MGGGGLRLKGEAGSMWGDLVSIRAGLRDWKSLTGGPDGAKSDRDKSRGATSSRGNSEQDAQILKSLWGDDVKIRQGQALMKPSEIRNRTPGRKRAKDWGECPLTFDKIKEPVRAGDGKVYEKWAIKKWLEENNNRSPLTNTNIGPVLTPLTDEDEGQVFGERTEITGGQDTGSKKNEIKTEINTVLNAVRGVIPVDEAQYTEVPVAPDRRSSTGSSAVQPRQPTMAHTESSQGESDGKTPNQLIADVMRDNSLTMQQKNDRIQVYDSLLPDNLLIVLRILTYPWHCAGNPERQACYRCCRCCRSRRGTATAEARCSSASASGICGSICIQRASCCNCRIVVPGWGGRLSEAYRRNYA